MTERRIRIDTVRDKRKNGVQREIVGTTAGLSAGQPQPLNLLPHLLSLHQWRHPYAISSENVLDCFQISSHYFSYIAID